MMRAPAYRTRIFFCRAGRLGERGGGVCRIFSSLLYKDGNRASAGLFSVPAFFPAGPPTGGSLPNAASDDLRLSGPQGCGGFCLQSRKRKQKRDPTGREPSAACSVCAGSRSQGRKNVRPAVYCFFPCLPGKRRAVQGADGRVFRQKRGRSGGKAGEGGCGPVRSAGKRPAKGKNTESSACTALCGRQRGGFFLPVS